MATNQSTRRNVGFIMIAAMLFVTVAPGSAFAGIVGTGAVIAEETATANRDVLLEKLGRDDVRVQLEQMGVDPDEAVERVAAMTDQEVGALSAGLGDHPAGEGVGVGAAILIVLIVILILR